MTKTEIANLVRGFYAETLDGNLKARVHSTDNVVAVTNGEAAELCQRLMNLDYKALKEDNMETIKKRVEKFLGQHATPPEVDSPLYLHICRLFLSARIKAFEVLRDRSRGEYNNPHDRIDDLLFPPDEAVFRPAPPAAGPADEGEKFSAVRDLYIRDHKASGLWSEKTLHDMEDTYNLFIEISGDRGVRKYVYEDLLTVKEKLVLLPRNRNKNPKYRGKATHELLGMDIPKEDRLGINTVNKHLVRFSSLFGWAVKRGYAMANFAEGLCLSKSQLEHEERECYDQADLKRLAEVLPCDPRYPERYWVPLIGLHQGMRLDEICQLYVADITKKDGTPCFNITDKKPGQKLKNKTSEREIPIHPKLVSLGFLRYVDRLKSHGVERLWPRLNCGKNGYSSALENWYQVFNRAEITENPKRVFHSFRHNVANAVPKSMYDVTQYVLGHAADGGTTKKRYIKPPSVAEMLAALRKVDYKLDFAPFDTERVAMRVIPRRKLSVKAESATAVGGEAAAA